MQGKHQTSFANPEQTKKTKFNHPSSLKNTLTSYKTNLRAGRQVPNSNSIGAADAGRQTVFLLRNVALPAMQAIGLKLELGEVNNHSRNPGGCKQ